MTLKKSIGLVVTSTLFITVTAFADDIAVGASNNLQQRNDDENIYLYTNDTLDVYTLFAANI